MQRNITTLIGMAMLAGVSTATAGNGPGGYPDKPVSFVVAFGPGGGTDLVARLVARYLSEQIGGEVIVENRPGASGIVAAQYVARAEPDGYKLLIGGSGPMVFNQVTYENLPYDPVNDFEPITILGSYPIVLLAGNHTDIHTLDDLVEHAKANPGELNYGSAGASFQVPTEYFASEAGIDLTQILYKGTAAAAQGLLAGDIELLSADIGPGAPLAQGNQARPLAVTSANRNPILPDVPTIAEQGYEGFDFSLYSAIAAPAGTPEEITNYLQEQLHIVLHSPEVKNQLAEMGILPEGMPPSEAAARYAREVETFRPIAEAAGIKVD